MANIDTAVLIHLIAALIALPLGSVVLLREKGTAVHKAMGRIWVVVMIVTAGSSFWITGLTGGWSWIHLLSVWTFIAIGIALWSIRKGNVKRHRGYMQGTFIGLLVAGALALLPGRLIWSLVSRAL